MKSCKLCETLDHQQKLNGLHSSNSSGLEQQDDKKKSSSRRSDICNHVGPNYGSYDLRDMFLAAQLLRGYYQPAGPLISSHLLPPQAPQVKSIPSPIDSDSLNLSQPPQSTSAAESSDSDVLITGGDLTPRPQTFRYGGPQVAPPQPPPGPYARPIHQMHCPTYPPSYYSPYSQHPQDMCYSPPYQPYYPAKVYPSTPPGYHRRYIPGTYYQVPPSDLYEAQPSSAPPPTGSQIVPAGASGPQHMEHYPPPPNYYGYNPGGSPCYTRGLQPYIEPPPYQPSCPCPMQSCPKNVHTGPLIGSSTNKGPVPSHLVSSHTGTIDLSGGSLTSNGVPSCKTESLSPIIVKPEATTLCFQAYHHDATSQAVQQQQQQHQQAQIQSNNNNNITTTSSNECKSQQFEKVALTPLPNYGHSNSKVHEPQSSISPARGSTGPPQLSTQASATGMTQHQIGDTQPRRARIGKSMVRERQMAFQNYYHNYPPHQKVPVQEKSATENNVMNNVTTTMTTMTSHHHNTQSNQQLMKKEMESQIIKLENDIKEEEKDDCIILDNKSDTDEDGGKQNGVVIIEDSPEAATFKRKSSMDADSIITISSPGLSTDETAPTSPTNKRRKLLASAGPVGICASKSASSPLKSYKSLIKQADPKAYLCTPNKYQKRQAVNMIKRMNFKNGRVGKRRMMMKIHKVVMISNNKKMRMTARKKQAKKNGLVSNNASVNTPCKTTFDVVRIEDEDSKCGDNSSVDTAIETVARGYFSESEIHQSQHSIKTKTKKSKVKTAESRSKSESSRITPNNDDPSALNGTEVTEEMSRDEVDQDQNPKIDGSQQMETTSENSSIDTSTKETKKNNTNQNNTKQGNNKLQKIKSKLENNSDTADAVDVVTTPVAVTQNNSVAVSVENNNNNSLIYDNNNKLIQQQQQQQTPSENEESAVAPQSEPCLLLPPPSHPHSSATFASPHAAAVAATKRNRSRTRKFSNKKRHRVKHYNVECVEEVLIPRKTNSTPKWSNGWMWEGQPFQGKVFLNSDDPPVMRTCYPAMRHSEGDIILPWDCVLLRAGGKKFELPYVAKVAHLWENPEDGEMMMSLLWYYRPEHTEQGRQPADSQDEVFASRHKDHNSVACIEDRCYVLTFSEYCRYRRCLKSYQENVEETPSIVPPLPSGNPLRCTNRQVPPPNTSPELVMFCRRVYEFRLKRLMKTPN